MLEHDFIVTTRRKARLDEEENARVWAQKLAKPYVKRQDFSLEALWQKFNVQNVLIVGKESLKFERSEGSFFFHPNMATVRISAIKRGKPDPMLEAMSVTGGERVLDCTLGLGADALVTASATQREVIALESSTAIAQIVAQGFKTYRFKDKRTNQAAKLVKVINCSYQDFLQSQADNSFDIVYFDPMFERTILESNGISIIRHFADYARLDELSIAQAKRVAKKRVVIKRRNFEAREPEFILTGSKWGKVKYLYWDKYHSLQEERY